AARGNVLPALRAARVAHVAGDRFAVRMQHVVVLAGDEPRTVRLDAPGRDDDVGLAGLERVAHVHPGHLFEPDAAGGAQRVRRVGAVVRIVAAVTAAHRARIGLAALTLRRGSAGGAGLLCGGERPGNHEAKCNESDLFHKLLNLPSAIHNQSEIRNLRSEIVYPAVLIRKVTSSIRSRYLPWHDPHTPPSGVTEVFAASMLFMPRLTRMASAWPLPSPAHFIASWLFLVLKNASICVKESFSS